MLKLKTIDNTIGSSILLFFQPPFLASDLLTEQKMTRSKKVILNSGNALVDFVCLSFLSLKIVAFEEFSWIYNNKIILKIA